MRWVVVSLVAIVAFVGYTVLLNAVCRAAPDGGGDLSAAKAERALLDGRGRGGSLRWQNGSISLVRGEPLRIAATTSNTPTPPRTYPNISNICAELINSSYFFVLPWPPSNEPPNRPYQASTRSTGTTVRRKICPIGTSSGHWLQSPTSPGGGLEPHVSPLGT